MLDVSHCNFGLDFLSLAACFVLIIIIIFSVLPPEGKTGLESFTDEDQVWVKCANPQCNASYKMNLMGYIQSVKETRSPG